ncbi:MAG: hypothetical protein M1831_006794 [Alyxoria varia]|nr:MAG: hypothetical protein M1831_006794 [Alyxoria varia]
MAETRQAIPELQLDVDLLILEYIICNATKALLDEHDRTLAEIEDRSRKRKRGSSRMERERSYAKPPSEGLLNHLNMLIRKYPSTTAFVDQFKTHHPNLKPDPTLSFRLTVLQFCTLYTLRHTVNVSTSTRETLSTLRHSNTQRARRWLQRSAHLNQHSQFQRESYQVHGDRPGRSVEATVAAELLDADTAHVRGDRNQDVDMDVHVREQSRVCDSQGQEPPILLDLVPWFVEIAAKRVRMFEDAHDEAGNNAGPGEKTSDAGPREKNPEYALSVQWLELAGELMLQAALETEARYEDGTIGGTEDEAQHAIGSKIMEAFAWGPLPSLIHEEAAGNDENHDEHGKEDTDLNSVFLICDEESTQSSTSSESAEPNPTTLTPHPWLTLRASHLRIILPLNPPSSYSITFHTASTSTPPQHATSPTTRLQPSQPSFPPSSSPLASPSKPSSNQPGVPTQILSHLCRSARRGYPVLEFGRRMCEYLRAMSESVGVPVLVQVERAAGEGGGSGGPDEAARRGKDRPGWGKEKEKQPPQLEVDGKPLDAETTDRILRIFRMAVAGCPSKNEAGE